MQERCRAGMQEVRKGCRTGVQSPAGAVVVRGGFREYTEGYGEDVGEGRRSVRLRKGYMRDSGRRRENLEEMQKGYRALQENSGDAGAAARTRGAREKCGKDSRSGGDAVMAQRRWRGAQPPYPGPYPAPRPLRYLRAQRSGATNMAASPPAPPRYRPGRGPGATALLRHCPAPEAQPRPHWAPAPPGSGPAPLPAHSRYHPAPRSISAVYSGTGHSQAYTGLLSAVYCRTGTRSRRRHRSAQAPPPPPLERRPAAGGGRWRRDRGEGEQTREGEPRGVGGPAASTPALRCPRSPLFWGKAPPRRGSIQQPDPVHPPGPLSGVLAPQPFVRPPPWPLTGEGGSLLPVKYRSLCWLSPSQPHRGPPHWPSQGKGSPVARQARGLMLAAPHSGHGEGAAWGHPPVQLSIPPSLGGRND